jgi:hypothetical protein
VRESLAQKFNTQRFDIRKRKEEHQVKISKRFRALQKFDDNVDINRASENILRI